MTMTTKRHRIQQVTEDGYLNMHIDEYDDRLDVHVNDKFVFAADHGQARRLAEIFNEFAQ